MTKALYLIRMEPISKKVRRGMEIALSLTPPKNNGRYSEIERVFVSGIFSTSVNSDRITSYTRLLIEEDDFTSLEVITGGEFVSNWKDIYQNKEGSLSLRDDINGVIKENYELLEDI